MHQQKLYLFNSLMSSSVRSGQLKEGLQLFQQGMQEGVVPDKVTFVSILSAFAEQAALTEAKQMHTYTIASGCELDVKVGTSLIHMYGKYNRVDYARRMFETMPVKNVITWNAMITALAQNRHKEMVLHLFAQMESEGVLPNRVTFIVIVNACANMLDLAEGMRMHALIIATGFALDVVVETALVTMYGKCGSPDVARTVFDRMPRRNVVSWTAMITVCAENGQRKEAFQLLSQMQGQGVVPNEITIISLLDVCARQAVLLKGMHLHTLILAFGFESLMVVSNALVNLYGKCGHPEEASKIFISTPEKDVISWNGMISAYTCNGQSMEAFKIFMKMCQRGVRPSTVTFTSMLDACANLGSPSEAHKIHFCIVNEGLESDPMIRNAFISVYGLCSSLKDARVMFDKIFQRDTVTWNAMLGAYVQHGNGNDALTLFRQMVYEGVMPNSVTFISIFSACASLKRLLIEGRQLHACILVGSGLLSDMVVQNALLNMYSKCDSFLEAHNIFINMAERNVISWNVMMSAYTQYNQGKKVLQLFNEMLWEGTIPDGVSFVYVLNACASQAALAEGKQIHIRILASRHQQNLLLWNALVDMYGKCNNLECALKVFDELLEPDLITWNAMIAASVEDNLALVLFDHMLQQGMMPDKVTFVSIITACASQPTLAIGKRIHARIVVDSITTSDIVMGTALVKMYGSCGEVENACRTFDKMLERNVVSWNAILTAYGQAGQAETTLKLFNQMHQEDVTPDEITFVGLLSACSHEGLIDEALNLYSVMEHNHGLQFIEDHYNCMIDALGRAGQLDRAEYVLKSIPLQVSLVSVMTLLGACKTHLDFERGRLITRRILEFDPDAAATYVKLTNLFDNVKRV